MPNIWRWLYGPNMPPDDSERDRELLDHLHELGTASAQRDEYGKYVQRFVHQNAKHRRFWRRNDSIAKHSAPKKKRWWKR